MAARRMPDRMNKYGLNRPDILLCSLWIFLMRRATPVPENPQAINVSKFQGVLTQSRKMADVDFKIYLDTIVERIESDLNNFIQLEKAPSRQYRIGESNLSKFERQRFLKNPSWQNQFPSASSGRAKMTTTFSGMEPWNRQNRGSPIINTPPELYRGRWRPRFQRRENPNPTVLPR